MNRLLVLLLIIISTIETMAQNQAVSLSLKDAQEYALKHNKNLINAKNDIEIAKENIKISRSSGLPQVNASLDYMTNFNYEFSLDFGGSSSPVTIDYSQFDAGDYEVMNAISQMFGSSSSSIVMKDQSNANVQVSQLIFSGQYWLGLQMAKLGKQIAEQNLQKTEVDVKENVASSYYLTLVTQELLKIIKENKNNLQEILKHTADMKIAGLVEETDVDQIKITLSQIENSKKVMERNLELNFNTLRFLLGIDLSEEIVLQDNLEQFLSQINSEKLIDSGLDLSNNPTFQLIETQEKISEKSVAMQRWAYAPTISGYYAYKEKLLTTSFDLSPKNTAGLTLSLPIFSGWKRQAQLNQAEIELDKVNTNKSLLEEQLNLQDKQLIFELNSSFENYVTQKENVDVAKRVYENIHNKYNQGRVSSLDLTQANSNYLQAESNYVSAILSLLQSKLKLDKLHNNL